MHPVTKANVALITDGIELPPSPKPQEPDTKIKFYKRVWRTIDSRQKGNEALAGTANSISLRSLLERGILDGEIKVYKGGVDGLRTELTRDRLNGLMNQQNDKGSLAITKYSLREDWFFDKLRNKMIVQIIALAPLMESVLPDGTISEQPLYWIILPDCRNYFGRFTAGEKIDQRYYTWYEYFESRQFVGVISKVASNTNRVAQNTDSISSDKYIENH